MDPAAAGGYAGEDTRAANLVDLIHMALACDLSRVVSLELTSSMSGIVLPTSLGITYRNWDGSPLDPPPLHEATHGQGNNLTVAECIRWHMKHVAALAKKLKDTPEATGNMLDNTAIVFVHGGGHRQHQQVRRQHRRRAPPAHQRGDVGPRRWRQGPGPEARPAHRLATGHHPASVSLTAMRAVGGSQMSALGEITAEIPGLRA